MTLGDVVVYGGACIGVVVVCLFAIVVLVLVVGGRSLTRVKKDI